MEGVEEEEEKEETKEQKEKREAELMSGAVEAKDGAGDKSVAPELAAQPAGFPQVCEMRGSWSNDSGGFLSLSSRSQVDEEKGAPPPAKKFKEDVSLVCFNAFFSLDSCSFSMFACLLLLSRNVRSDRKDCVSRRQGV